MLPGALQDNRTRHGQEEAGEALLKGAEGRPTGATAVGLVILLQSPSVVVLA